MGQIVDRLRDLFLGVTEMKVLMVGLDAAGKTTILYKMKLGEAVSTIPTVGFNVESVSFHHNTLTCWDIGGQDKLRPLWRHYFIGNDAVAFVVDTSDEARFGLAREELHKMLRNPELRNSILMVFANKQDLPHAVTTQQLIDALELESIRDRSWYVQSCCAMTGDGLYEAFDWITREVKVNRARIARRS